MLKINSKYTYSELSNLKNIPSYSLEEFIRFFHEMKVEILEKKQITVVKVFDEKTEYLFHFDKKGKFIKIHTEYWKDLGIKFTRLD